MTICVLLAAGSSSRMQQAGQPVVPKMLLPYKQTTLLQHLLAQVSELKAARPLVVTGCFHAALMPVLVAEKTDVVYNAQWQNGMGSSIKCSIDYLTRHYPAAETVLILVCDQPHISTTLLSSMIEEGKVSGKGIVACFYGDSPGTPVLFSKKYFPALLGIDDAAGAKKMVQQFRDDTHLLPFDEGAIDIDTPADYRKINP